MKRREWIAAPLCFLLPALPPAWAQPAGPLRRGLRERGYVEGQNLQIEAGFGDDKVERLRSSSISSGSDSAFPGWRGLRCW